MKKWPDLPHWEWEATYLGNDEYGDWLAQPAGRLFTRPGVELRIDRDSVTLVPNGPWVATFYAQAGELHHARIYVDMATPAQWNDDLMTSVDLDLDVIRRFSGDVMIDDEDEFAEHQVSFGYSPELIAMAERSCATVHRAVLEESGAFDLDVSSAWLRKIL